MVPAAFVRARRAAAHRRTARSTARALPAPDAGRARAPRRTSAPRDADRGDRSPASGPSCSASSGSARTTTSSTLGGHSLLAARLAWRSAHGRAIALRALFEAPTVAELAAAIEATGAAAGAAAPPPLVPGRARRRAARSRSRRSGSGSSTSSSRRARRTTSRSAAGCAARSTPARSRGALGELVARHEVLRTTFPAPRGGPCQVVHAPASWQLQLHDLAALPGAERAAELARDSTPRRAGPSISRAGRWCARAARRARRRTSTSLLVTMHHIVSDGWSVGVFWRELERALRRASSAARRRCRARRSSTPTTPPGSARWLTGRRARRAARVLEAAARRRARGLGPADQWPRPPVQTLPRRVAARCGSSATLARAAARARAARARRTLFMTLLAALRRAARTATPARATSCSARRSPTAARAEIEGADRPLRQHAGAAHAGSAGTPTFPELLGRVSARPRSSAYAHQDDARSRGWSRRSASRAASAATRCSR